MTDKIISSDDLFKNFSREFRLTGNCEDSYEYKQLKEFLERGFFVTTYLGKEYIVYIHEVSSNRDNSTLITVSGNSKSQMKWTLNGTEFFSKVYRHATKKEIVYFKLLYGELK